MNIPKILSKIFQSSQNSKQQKHQFDKVGNFKGEFAIVRLNEMENFINKKGEIISSRWFDFVDGFYNGFARVRSSNKYNFIDKNGGILSPQWFDYCCDFHDDFALVELNKKWNYIGRNGKLLSNQWFSYCYSFQNGHAFVKIDDKWWYIDKDGKLNSPHVDNKLAIKTINTKDMEENQEKKILYIVLVDKEYIDSFTNAEDALVCVLKNQEAGQISVIKKPI